MAKKKKSASRTKARRTKRKSRSPVLDGINSIGSTFKPLGKAAKKGVGAAARGFERTF